MLLAMQDTTWMQTNGCSNIIVSDNFHGPVRYMLLAAGSCVVAYDAPGELLL
jgi:hypothetical protein